MAVPCVPILSLVVGIVALPSSLASQQSTRTPPCLRFAFGPWRPPLDWEGAGHAGSAEHNGEAVRRLRDSIFLQQPGRDHGDGMAWDERSNGARLYLFPEWWPAGVVIQFDTTAVAGDTLHGVAEAMVADAGAQRSTARVRALRVACGNSR